MLTFSMCRQMLPLEIIDYVGDFAGGRERCFIRKYIVTKECRCRDLTTAAEIGHVQAIRRHIRSEAGKRALAADYGPLWANVLLHIGYTSYLVDILRGTASLPFFYWNDDLEREMSSLFDVAIRRGDVRVMIEIARNLSVVNSLKWGEKLTWTFVSGFVGNGVSVVECSPLFHLTQPPTREEETFILTICGLLSAAARIRLLTQILSREPSGTTPLRARLEQTIESDLVVSGRASNLERLLRLAAEDPLPDLLVRLVQGYQKGLWFFEENRFSLWNLDLSSMSISAKCRLADAMMQVHNMRPVRFFWAAVEHLNQTLVRCVLHRFPNLIGATHPESGLPPIDHVFRTASFARYQKIEILVKSGARVSRGFTLWEACQKNEWQLVRLLLQTDPRLIDARDKKGKTPLVVACGAGSYQTVWCILRNLPLLPSRRQLEKARTAAACGGYCNILHLLESHSQKPNFS